MVESALKGTMGFYLFWLLHTVVTYLPLYLGYVENIEGMQNLSIFLVWGYLFPVSFFCAGAPDEMIQDVAKKPTRYAAQFANQVLRWVAMITLVWVGAWVLAIGWAFHMFLMAVANVRVGEARKKLNMAVPE